MLLSLILGLVVLLTTIHIASAKIGAGHLYIYLNSNYTTLASQDDKGFYEVFPGQEVYIQIANITEFNIGKNVIVKIGFEVDGNDYTYITGPLTVKTLTSGAGENLPGVGDASQVIAWTVGQYNDPTPSNYIDIPPCSTITVHYKDASGTGPEFVTYDATPPCITAHLHVIPGNPFGTLGAISLLLVGFGAFLLIKNRKSIPVLKF